jgi:hypothetical protein
MFYNPSALDALLAAPATEFPTLEAAPVEPAEVAPETLPPTPPVSSAVRWFQFRILSIGAVGGPAIWVFITSGEIRLIGPLDNISGEVISASTIKF